MKPGIDKIYEGAIDAESIARAITFAIEQPENVAINEMIIRPTSHRTFPQENLF
ncbi:hypothetical protein BGM25_14960 [Bacillus sp. FJAT-29953]|nr:hypothetical protein [Bacillus sp. FJAT-29953]